MQKLQLSLFFYLIIIVESFVSAQSIIIEGKVFNIQTHQAVPYATLGIKGKSIGTVTDEKGVFHFTINSNQLSSNDMMIVSSIGYQSNSIAIKQFEQGQQNIGISPIIINLNVVTVKPTKLKTKVYGRTGNGTIMVATMFSQKQLIDDNLGKEEAAILNIDDNCYLKDFNMYVVANRFKNVKFRLNFYSVKNSIPDSIIVNQNIIFDVGQKRGWVKVDLTPYNIYLTGYNKIAVAIQWLKSEKIDSTSHFFTVSATLSALHSIFFRDKSQAEWKKVSNANVTFNLTADEFKSSKKNSQEVTAEKEDVAQLSDSFQNLINYNKFAEEAASSIFGHNSSTGKYLHLNNAAIYYETYGKGKPLLLLHGNGQSISSFYQQIGEFAKYYRVITVDTRAQGKSTDSLNHQLSYELFANDMKLLMDSLHIKTTDIVGWSDGGNTGLIIAMKYPSYVNKLVVMGANLFPKGVDNQLLDDFRKEYKKIQVKTDSNSINHKRLTRLLIEEPNLNFEDLKQIKARVLVMAGEKDVIKKEHTNAIANHIKDSKLIIIKDATHYAPQEKPVEFNQFVLDFLKN